MKSKITSVLLMFLLVISLMGCSSISDSSSASSNKISYSNIKTTPSTTSSESKSQTRSTTTTTTTNAVEAYKAVLQNKAEFFSTDNKKNIYLNDFLTNKEIIEADLKVTHFTVLDMDGDKTPEVVLELSVDNNPVFYEVLHYMNDKVYGYNIVYRGLEMLKMDGTFWASGGAADNVCGKLNFKTDSYETDVLGYMKSSQSNGGMTISYFINNKPVTKESFDSFTTEQNGKKAAAWYEFSEKNIENELIK